MCPTLSETLPQAPSTATELRDWLRQLKDQADASYAEIARAIGEEERTVKRWMTGTKPSVPAGDSLLRLLDFFGVKITPPPPRSIPLSLVGELRDLRNEVVHFRHGYPFSLNEFEVISGIAEGESNVEIARRLGMPEEEVALTFRSVVERMKETPGRDRLDVALPDNHLGALEAKVAELPTAEDLGKAVATLQAAIDRLAIAGSHEAQPAKPARKRGAK